MYRYVDVQKPVWWLWMYLHIAHSSELMQITESGVHQGLGRELTQHNGSSEQPYLSEH